MPRSFLKGALYEIIDFYRAAPYKRRGMIPFGVQHGTFLTTEEKVRERTMCSFVAEAPASVFFGVVRIVRCCFPAPPLQQAISRRPQVRRRWAQWASSGGSSNGKGDQLAVASDPSAVSYRELVNSYR